MARMSKEHMDEQRRLAAKRYREMELGIYSWPDGKPHLDPKTGRPLTNKLEVLRSLGYSDKYKGAYKSIFETEEFNTHYEEEKLRTSKELTKYFSHVASDVDSLHTVVGHELAVRLQADPGSFSNGDLIRLYTSLEKLRRTIKLHNEEPQSQGPDLSDARGVLAERLPQEEMNRIDEAIAEQKVREARMIMDQVYERKLAAGEIIEQ